MDTVSPAPAPTEDAEMKKGSLLFRYIADGYSGEQILDRFAIPPDRAEQLIALYVHRVVYGTAPAGAPVCSINDYDGWCMRHGCYHPADAR